MKTLDFSNKIKQLLFVGEEVFLPKIKVILKRYIGYNYDSHQHEYVDTEYEIVKIYRAGKKGVVYMCDIFGNQFSPKEFKESDLDLIFEQINNR